jgi:diguanylate cyclase (GGDEF)-like protein
MLEIVVMALIAITVLQSIALAMSIAFRRRARWQASSTQASSLPLPTDRPNSRDELLGDYQNILRETLTRVGVEGEGIADIGTRLAEHGNDVAAVFRAELTRRVSALVEANNRLRVDLAAAQKRLEAQCAALERLSAESRHDCLTQLPNRRAFDERVVELFGRYKRYGESFVMVIFDVDSFKSFNDNYGHAAGDAVLAAIAKVVSDRRRSTDFVARIGGEEFAILLTNTTLRQAEQCVDGYRKTIESTIMRSNDRVLRVTASFGASEVLTGESASSLKDRADQALYAAKAAGRNRARFHDGAEIVSTLAEDLAAV